MRPKGKGKAARQEEEEEEDEDKDEDEDWTEVEVGFEDLAPPHPPAGGLVGLDVCVLSAAFPSISLKKPDSIGWRE